MTDLHEQLRSLVAQHGTGIADSAEQFRAALDDYLTEEDATQGELNLLVDSVRLGGVERLLNMLDNGADADAAVREAGGELARDRSSDEQRSRWAVATMGYALGRVGVAVVRQQLEGDETRLPYGATAPAAPPPTEQRPPAQSPPYQSPVQSPPHQPIQSPGWQPPAHSPGPESGPPAWPSRHPSHPAPVSGYGMGPTPPRKSRTGLIVGLVAAGVIAVTVAIVLALVTSSGDDDPEEKADDNTTTESTGCEGDRCLEGEGYSYELPDDWTNITDQVQEQNPNQPTLDTASAWGRSIEGGRANVIVEVDAWVYSDLDDAREVLSNNLSSLGGTLENIESRTIDGEEAAGVLLKRDNDSGVSVEQTAYIVKNGDDAVVITASNKANDEAPQDAYEEIYDSWSWE